MKKLFFWLMAIFAVGLANAGPTVFLPQAGEDEGWAKIEQQLIGANALQGDRIEVPVLGALAYQILKETDKVKELHPTARSEEGAIAMMENILGGKEVTVSAFRERVKAGGISFPDEAEVERTRIADALASLAATQDALRRELTKLTQEKSQAAASQRAEVAKLQREIAGMESELKAQTANQGKRLGESLAAAAAARNALEERVKAATDKALTLTGRVLEVQKQVTAIEAAPIMRNGNFVMGAVLVIFLSLLGVVAHQLILRHRMSRNEKLARNTAKIPEETVKLANTTYVMVKEAQLTAQNAQSDIASVRTVANEAKTIATETKTGFEKLRAEVQREIDIPDNLRGDLRELTADNLSHKATVSVDEQSFTLSFVFAEQGKVFVRGIKDQENAVAIDRVPSVIRRAARDNRVVGWEAMQRKDPAPKPTVLRQVQPPTASEDSLLARAAARARPTEVDVLVG